MRSRSNYDDDGTVLVSYLLPVVILTSSRAPPKESSACKRHNIMLTADCVDLANSKQEVLCTWWVSN